MNEHETIPAWHRPTRIRFGPYVASVHTAEGQLEEHELGQIEWGGHDPKIHLKPGMSWVQERSTLIHEALHLADDAAALGLGEEGVQRLEFALMELLDKNPSLFYPLT
ncbi:MAG TPA: hypothetical protein VJ997_06390 [Longimicrobiales bacterium]|nr:hypothetical protein [Longimicrobiales bacterium]